MLIAHLAPESPALSATFVYEELLGLERLGVGVLPLSVRRPAHFAPGQEVLAKRTRILYDRSPLPMVFGALGALPRFGRRSLTALGWLARDMASVGLLRITAWKLVFQWFMAARLARLLQHEGCTHLHVHFAHTPTQIAMYASAFSGIPFTLTAHANDIFERGLLLPQKARRAVRMLTISRHNVAYLRSVGVDERQLAVVRCGVSFAPPALRRTFEHRARYRIGTLGRLVEKKGFDDLLRAVALLRSAPWVVELSIAGDGPLRASLEALAGALGVQGQVRFEGAMRHQDVTPWLRSLDVFALACKPDANGDMDGIPVVLIEAMSQFVPVVSTQLSGIPELVIHNETGLLAQPADPIALAAELRRMLNDPALRERLANGGAKHVDAEFSQSINLARLMHHFTP